MEQKGFIASARRLNQLRRKVWNAHMYIFSIFLALRLRFRF